MHLTDVAKLWLFHVERCPLVTVSTNFCIIALGSIVNLMQCNLLLARLHTVQGARLVTIAVVCRHL